jgi:protein-S-isoprenylcysteine O-methyltransferase Ste14
MSQHASRDAPMPHPGVYFPPPFLFVAGYLAAWLLDRVARFRFVGGDASRVPVVAAGWAVLALGLAVMLWGFGTFLGKRTAIIPNKAASRLVIAGPYRYSRNPMYTGMTIAYTGVALLTNRAWALVLLPLVLGALYLLVIRREERYLGGAFGDEYATYRRTVRRWL